MNVTRRRLALAVAASVVAALSYRAPVDPDSQLDGSWRYALAAASADHLVFGRDLNYTYGPLGWLSAPLRTPYHHFALPLLLAVIAVACGLAVARLIAVTQGWRRGVIVFVLALGAFAWRGTDARPAIPADYQLIFIATVALVSAASNAAGASIAFAIAGAAAGLAIGVSFSAMAVISLASLATLGFTLPTHPRRAARLAAIATAAFFLTATASLFDTLRHGVAAAYVRDSIDLASGYAAAMGSAGTIAEGRAAIAAVLLGLLLIAVYSRAGSPRVAALCGILLITGWKHATIREGLEHAPYLYATLALVTAIIIAAGAKRTVSIGATILGAAALIHLGTLDAVYHRSPLPTLGDGVIAPPTMRWSNETIDALPSDAITAILSGGVYHPLPVFQLFAAYTPRLDAEDADALKQRGAEVVLYRFTSIDNRYPFSDAPLVIRGLLCQYTDRGEVHTRDRRPFVELRRSVDRCRERVIGDVSNPNDSIVLPQVGPNEFISARITFSQTPLGSAQALFGRIQPPSLTFDFANGAVVLRTIVAATARDGIIVDPAPGSQTDAQALFAQHLVGNVVSIRISPGPAYQIRLVRLLRTQRMARRPNADNARDQEFEKRRNPIRRRRTSYVRRRDSR